MSAISCALPKGKLFLGKILHVQHVDKTRATTTEISDLELILNVLKEVRHRRDEEEEQEEEEDKIEEEIEEEEEEDSKRDGDRDKYASPDKSEKFKILKQSFGNQICDIGVYSNPLPKPLKPLKPLKLPKLPKLPKVGLYHAFAVFRTNQIPESESAAMWWSFDKNGHYVLLQQSPNKADVLDSVFDVNKEKIGPRLLPVKELTTAQGKYMSLEDLLESILYSSQLSTVYHVWSANCQKFASYVFQTANGEGKKWKTLTCGSLPDEKETLFGAGVNAIRYDSIAKQDKLIPYYQALLEKEGLPEFKRILSNYSGEFINQVDCHGYTLLDWARAFSRDDLENHLIECKGAVHQPTNSKSSRQNVFHIALQYLDSKKDCAKLSSDGIDLAGVNSIGDSTLHLALYGGKWKIAMEILKKMKKLSMPVDRTNRKGETILHIITKLACPPKIFAEILGAIPKEKVDMTDDEGFNALHWATKIGSPRKVKSLLENGADVNAETEDGDTALDLAMQDELNLEFKNKIVKKLLKKEAKGNTDDAGFTPLHLAIMEDTIAIEQIRKMMKMCPDDVDLQDHCHGDTPLMTVLDNQSERKTELLLEVANVNVKNKKGMTGLHYAAMWPTIPEKFFEKILSQSTDLNAKDNEGDTALHCALREKSAGAAQQLLRAENVDANIRNEKNEMAIHLAEKWENIPIKISKLIREKTTVM